MTTYTKGLRATIIKADPTHNIDAHDFSNDGISNRYGHVTIVGPGIPEISCVTADAPAVVVGTIEFMGKIFKHLRPADEPAGKQLQAGGAFVYSTDARFAQVIGNHQPISLHDRDESKPRRPKRTEEYWTLHDIKDTDIDLLRLEWDIEDTRAYSGQVDIDRAELLDWIEKWEITEFGADELRHFLDDHGMNNQVKKIVEDEWAESWSCPTINHEISGIDAG